MPYLSGQEPRSQFWRFSNFMLVPSALAQVHCGSGYETILAQVIERYITIFSEVDETIDANDRPPRIAWYQGPSPGLRKQISAARS